MKLSYLRGAVASLVVGFAVAASQGANAATTQPASLATVPARAVAVSYDFATLDEAVAAGKLDRLVVDGLRHEGTVEAIVSVRYASTFSAPGPQGFTARAEALERTFAAKELAALRPAGEDVSVLRTYDSLPSTFVRFESDEAILDVLNAPDVLSIRANTPVPVATQQSLNVVRQPQAAAAGHTGAGTYVAVLDTGVDYTRAPFGCTAASTPSTCKVALSREQDTDPETYLDEGSLHGTNVAGIVASVAPGTKILAYDVFDYVAATQDLRSYPENQLAAVQHVIDLKKAGWNVVAINLSLGGGWYTGTCNADLNFSLARDYGILPVVAAGNDAVTNGAFRSGIAAPACDTNAISVGAVYDASIGSAGWRNCTDQTTAQDKITCFSQTGSNLDLLAPGALITAAGITQGGTSQAAPHVAGAVAVLAAAKHGSRLYYRAEAALIESALRNSGPSIYDSRSQLSFRRLDVYSALTTLIGGGGGGAVTDTTPPVVSTPVEQFDGPISTSGAIVKLSWSASDPSGISEYSVYSRVNGGQWVRETAIPATATSWKFVLSFGTRFEFSVAAKDGAGNWSTFQNSPSLTPGYSDDRTWQLPGWSRYSWADSFGGTGITSSQAGTSITHTFTGRDVALIAPLFTTGGRGHVYCDGAFKATIDLYSATVRPREVAYWCRFAQYGQHTMKIVVEGTAGRPRFDIDAFAVLQ